MSTTVQSLPYSRLSTLKAAPKPVKPCNQAPGSGLNTSFFRRQVTYPKTRPTGDWVTLSLQRLRCPTRRVSADPPNKDSLRLRPRDAEGRFLPVDAPHPHPQPLPAAGTFPADTPPASSPSDTPSQLLEEFRNHVDDACPQLCRGVIAQGIEGNRWALEHVFQYTIGDWRLHIVEPHEESRLHRYLAEIAHAMRTPDDDNPTDNPNADPDADNACDPDDHPDDNAPDPYSDPLTETDDNPTNDLDNGNPYDPAP